MERNLETYLKTRPKEEIIGIIIDGFKQDSENWMTTPPITAFMQLIERFMEWQEEVGRFHTTMADLAKHALYVELTAEQEKQLQVGFTAVPPGYLSDTKILTTTNLRYIMPEVETAWKLYPEDPDTHAPMGIGFWVMECQHDVYGRYYTLADEPQNSILDNQRRIVYNEPD